MMMNDNNNYITLEAIEDVGKLMKIKIKVNNLKKVLSQLDRLQKDMEQPFQEIS